MLKYNKYDIEWAEGFDEILEGLGGAPPDDDEVFQFMCETKIDMPSNAYYELVLSAIQSEIESQYPDAEVSYYVNARDTNLYINQEPVNDWEEAKEKLEQQEEEFARGGMTISEIKRRTSETSPHFFDRKSLKFFGQRMSDFKVSKQDDGKYLISAPTYRTDYRTGKRIQGSPTQRLFNPETNELERVPTTYAHGGQIDYGEIRENLQSLGLPTDAGDRTLLVEEINERYNIDCGEVIRALSDDDVYVAVDGLLRDYGVYASDGYVDDYTKGYAKGGMVKVGDKVVITDEAVADSELKSNYGEVLRIYEEEIYDGAINTLVEVKTNDGKVNTANLHEVKKLYAKGGLVAVRGYGDIHYSDFQDISANIEIDGQDEIEKIDIDDIDGGSPHDIYSQIDDIITRRAQTDSRYDNAKLTLVEFELKDGSFFDIYDLEDDFYSSEWRDNSYAKGGMTKNKYKLEDLTNTKERFFDDSRRAMSEYESMIDDGLDVSLYKLNKKGKYTEYAKGGSIKDMSFGEFYDYLNQNDLGYWDNVNSEEIVRMYIDDMNNKGVNVSHIEEVLENNPSRQELYEIWLGNSMETPTPINTKEDLLEALDLDKKDYFAKGGMTFDLTPSDRKSFYGKAKVITKGGINYLQSYSTIVAEYNPTSREMKIYDYYSPTTARHINAFLNHYGYPSMSKSEIMANKNKSFAKGGMLKHFIGDEGMFMGGEFRIKSHQSFPNRYSIIELDNNGKEIGKEYMINQKDFEDNFSKFAKGGMVSVEKTKSYFIKRGEKDYAKNWDKLSKDEKERERQYVYNILQKKKGKQPKKENNEMLIGGIAGILLGIFLNR